MNDDDRFSGIDFGAIANSKDIIEQNKLLINEINQNLESKGVESLSRNEGLIVVLDGNLKKVAELYADISRSLTAAVEALSEEISAGKGSRKRPKTK